MALISVQHLIAPFTNKVHLMSIFCVGVLFAMFRASQGDIRSTPTRRTERPPRIERQLVLPDEQASGRQAEDAAETSQYRAAAKPAQSDAIEDLLQGGAEKQKEKPKTADPLADIEKQFGIR